MMSLDQTLKTRARGGKPPSNSDIELSGLCLGLSRSMEFQEKGPAEAEQARHFWTRVMFPLKVRETRAVSMGPHSCAAKGTRRGDCRGRRPAHGCQPGSVSMRLHLSPMGHMFLICPFRGEPFAFSNWPKVAS